MSQSRVIHSSDGDVDEPERAGTLLDSRNAPHGRPDVLLELRFYVEPGAETQRWAVVSSLEGREMSADFATERRARAEYEATGPRPCGRRRGTGVSPSASTRRSPAWSSPNTPPPDRSIT